MATLLERASIAEAPNFIKRVQQGLVQVASEVVDEDPGTANHDGRLRLASAIFTNPGALASTFAQRVVLNENIGNTEAPVGADQETEDGDGALLYILRDSYNDYLGLVG